MATYATIADFEEHIEGWDTENPAALERILVRAERDIDRVLGPIVVNVDTGLKLDPADLDEHEREALARAVSSQAYHRITTRGEGTGGPVRQAKRVKGPDFEEDYGDTPAPAGSGLYAPDLDIELAPLRRFRRAGARARP